MKCKQNNSALRDCTTLKPPNFRFFEKKTIYIRKYKPFYNKPRENILIISQNMTENITLCICK